MSDVDPTVTPPAAPTPELALLSWPSRFDIAGERARPLERARQATTPRYHASADHGAAGAPVYDRRWLAERALAVALLALRDEGAVTMEVVTKKVMMVRRTHVLVSPTGAAGAGAANGTTGAAGHAAANGTTGRGAGHGGLGGQLLAVLAKPETVSDLVYRWFREDVSNPAGYVVGMVEAIGAGCGYYRRVDREGGALRRVFRAKFTYEPIAERLALLEPLADALGARWQALARDEPDLYRELLADVTRAIGRRVESPDVD
jgi:hypothetical protein